MGRRGRGKRLGGRDREERGGGSRSSVYFRPRVEISQRTTEIPSHKQTSLLLVEGIILSHSLQRIPCRYSVRHMQAPIPSQKI